MYWTHLIFALVLGLVNLSQWTIGTKPGYLDFDNLPETNFSCEGKVIGGYYADVETGCQMFHVCTIGQKAEVTDIKFLCLNGTVFDQETRVCERIDEVDCSKSEDFFGLNLELYGNNGNLGIQPENEFECEDCGTEDYDTETTTTTTTTTTPKPTTTVATTTTTTQPPKAYPASSPETFAALLALHNAFQESFNAKIKPPPPRVINNAFQTTKPPYPKIEYLHQPPRQKPIYQPTTPLPKANYHHFSSSDASFGHSFDHEKPYNFQFFHARKLEEPQKEVSVVTSTSTSTSVRTSKNLTEYDYEDLDFYDVPKIRQKREEKYPNHRYPDEHPNHNYMKNDTRENFLKNLLNSIDMEDTEREKMVKFFIKEEKEMDTEGMLSKLGHKLGEIIMEDVNKTIQKQNDSFDLDELSRLWKLHYEEMSREVNLDFNVDNKLRVKRDLKERPVFEEVDEGDFTTIPYRRVAHKQRTTSRPVKSIRFNYETSKNPPEPLETEGELTKGLTTSNYQAISRRTTTRPPRRLKTTRVQNDSPRESVSLRPKPTKTVGDSYETGDFSRDTKRPRNSDASESRQRVKIPRPTYTNDGSSYEADGDSSRDIKRPHRNGGETSESLRQNFRTNSNPVDISEEDGDSIKDDIKTTKRPLNSGSETSASSRQRVKIPRPVHNEDDDSEYDDSLRKTIPGPVISEEPNLRTGVRTPPRLVQNNDGDASEAIDSVKQRTQTTLKPHHNPDRSNQRATSRPRSVETRVENPIAQSEVPKKTRSRGHVRGGRITEQVTSTTTIRTSILPDQKPDPDFVCEGKVKGGFYADIVNDCRGFFICSQGQINGPLLKSHFWCGATTKFNQRSRTCQAENLVECSISARYFHLNNDFLVPETESDLKGTFEPMRV